MDQMADALKAVAGERMKTILARLTANRFMGAITGAFVTAVIQSSSVTTVLVVGFITAGLMSMAQSIGIIMGANIGTTITAQIIAFKVTEAALLMIAVGFTLLFTSKQEQIRHYGSILMGLGLVFFGMSVMSDAMAPLRTYPPFLELMTRMDNPLIGILTAALFTALVQSSSATTGIIIVMASQGFISLQAGIALAMGANIGTCVTAMLASIGKPREAVRAALSIREKTVRIFEECSALYRPLDINMGINSGEALVGAAKFETYSGSRWTYTARGNLTNVAARIGAQASALIFGIVAVNEVVSPVLFRLALSRSGEAGRLVRVRNTASSGETAPLPARTQA